MFVPGMYVGCKKQSYNLKLPPPWPVTGLPALPVVITAVVSTEGLVTLNSNGALNSNGTAINL